MRHGSSNLGRPAWLPGYDGKGVRKACQLIAAHLLVLQALDMSDVDFCDAELRELSPIIPQLQELRLHHSEQRSAITLHGVEAYVTSSCLVSLCVYVPSGDEDRFASWLGQYGGQLQQLQLCNGSTELRCPCRRTEDAKGRQRLKYGRIVRREICSATISSHLLLQLATLPELTSLTLLYYDLDDADAQSQLACLTGLTSLALVDSDLSDQEDFAGLMQALSCLQELQLRTCPHRPSHCRSDWSLDYIADGGFQAAAADLQQLTSLDLGQAAISKAAMQQLGSSFTQLSSLVVCYDGKVTDFDLQLLTGLQQLSRLVCSIAPPARESMCRTWRPPIAANDAKHVHGHAEEPIQACSLWLGDAAVVVAAPLLKLVNLVVLQLPSGLLRPSSALQLTQLQRLRYISSISCQNCSLHRSRRRCCRALRKPSAAKGARARSTAFVVTADWEPQVRAPHIMA
eukprot:gene6172-6410_t